MSIPFLADLAQLMALAALAMILRPAAPDWYSIPQVARKGRVSEADVELLIKDGRLRAEMRSGERVIAERNVRHWPRIEDVLRLRELKGETFRRSETKLGPLHQPVKQGAARVAAEIAEPAADIERVLRAAHAADELPGVVVDGELFIDSRHVQPWYRSVGAGRGVKALLATLRGERPLEKKTTLQRLEDIAKQEREAEEAAAAEQAREAEAREYKEKAEQIWAEAEALKKDTGQK